MKPKGVYPLHPRGPLRPGRSYLLLDYVGKMWYDWIIVVGGALILASFLASLWGSPVSTIAYLVLGWLFLLLSHCSQAKASSYTDA